MNIRNGANFRLYLLILSLLCTPLIIEAQYTEVINSNRPGQAVSAYSVGSGVGQLEFGFLYEKQDNSNTPSNSNIFGGELSLRYGLLFEELELVWDGIFQNQSINFPELGTSESRTDFLRNRLGAKYLIFDPYKNPERLKPNLYSWRANNKFQWKNLIPAVSLYAGANFVIGDNPFYPGDPSFSPRAMLATQSQLTPKSVLVLNFIYDRIGTDFPELSYLISYSRAFRNPKWSVFIENQGIQSDRYSDILLRTGVSHLFNENFQADVNIGANFKNSPSRYFGSLGLSYRLDYHKDKLVPIEDQESQNGGPIRKNSMKKSRKNSLGMSKKEIRRQRKQEKKRKKKQQEDDFEF